jgi:predicted metal-binding membrane protein
MTGAWHGIFCLGCCWALMLVAFALGMANLVWMAGLTVLMTLEKRWTHGPLLTRASGVWLTLVGLVVVAGPFLGGD